MKICLDAGHYDKYNRSPVNPSYYESYFTWDFHLILKEELEKRGFTVITTRKDQKTDLGLESRGKASKGCDLFLSIHSDAADNANVDRPLACCTVTKEANDLGQKLANTVAKTMGTNQNGIIWNKAQSDGRDWYGVLRGATSIGTPAILLEHSCHTNKRSTEWLLNKDNLRKLAIAEADLLADYFKVKKPDSTPSSEKPKDDSKPTEQLKQDYLFKVKVTCHALNVRKTPSTLTNNIINVVHCNEVYTIVEVRGNWGRLKAGGWMNISSLYVKRV